MWLAGVQRLNQTEAVRFVFVIHTIMLQFQNNFYLVEEGTLDPRMLEAINNTLVAVSTLYVLIAGIAFLGVTKPF